MSLTLTRRALSLCPLLLWGLGACVANRTPARPGEEVIAAPATSASQPSAALPAASDSASAGPAVASASARPAAGVKRLPPATKAQLGGTCSLGAPITIGKSTASDESGPDVAIAASSEGVVASWLSSDDQVTTIALDSLGRPRGEGRTMVSSARKNMLQLWELSGGKFVLAFMLPEPAVQRSNSPEFALQRVDASGELVGSPVPLPSGQIRAVTPFKDQLLMLTRRLDRELLRVAAADGGLEVKRAALPKYPGDISLRETLVPTASGAAWVISEEVDNVLILEREEGKSAKIKAPPYPYKTVLSEDEGLVWVDCQGTPTVRGMKLHEGKLADVELPKSVCAGPSFAVWDVGPAPHKHKVNNQALGLLLSDDLLFTRSSLETRREPSMKTRYGWFYNSTWTGTSVLTIYPTGKRRDRTIVAQPITCEGSVPPPAASASAPSSATETNRTKN